MHKAIILAQSFDGLNWFRPALLAAPNVCNYLDFPGSQMYIQLIARKDSGCLPGNGAQYGGNWWSPQSLGSGRDLSGIPRCWGSQSPASCYTRQHEIEPR